MKTPIVSGISPPDGGAAVCAVDIDLVPAPMVAARFGETTDLIRDWCASFPDAVKIGGEWHLRESLVATMEALMAAEVQP